MKKGSTATDYTSSVVKTDEIHRVMMEMEPLLEASGKQSVETNALDGFNRLIKASTNSGSWSYDGYQMAGSSFERK